MKKLIYTLAFILFPSLLMAVEHAPGPPFIPPASDMEMIRAGVSGRMLDPESTILSGVVAARKQSGDEALIWVCGNVRAKNGFGGYAQPVPFMGSIVETATGGRSFLLIAISGPSAAEQSTVLNACLERLQ